MKKLKYVIYHEYIELEIIYDRCNIFFSMDCENFVSRNDVHQISRERNQHIEAFQDADRDNVTLREELKKYNMKLEKLIKSKVSI